MEFEELSMKAYKKEGAGKFADLPTRYAYLKLEDLYFKYRSGSISKEKSSLEKSKIEKEYNQDMYDYNRSLEINKEYLENRKISTELLCDIGKSKNKEEILKYSLEIISNFIADDSFVSRTLKQIEENTQIDF